MQAIWGTPSCEQFPPKKTHCSVDGFIDMGFRRDSTLQTYHEASSSDFISSFIPKYHETIVSSSKFTGFSLTGCRGFFHNPPPSDKNGVRVPSIIQLPNPPTAQPSLYRASSPGGLQKLGQSISRPWAPMKKCRSIYFYKYKSIQSLRCPKICIYN